MCQGKAMCLHLKGKPIDYIGHCLNLASRLNNLARPKGIVFDSNIQPNSLPQDIRKRFRQEKVYIAGISEESGQLVKASLDVMIPKHALSPSVYYRQKRERIDCSKDEIFAYGDFIEVRLAQKPASVDSIAVTLVYPSNVAAERQNHKTFSDFEVVGSRRCKIFLSDVRRLYTAGTIDSKDRVCFRAEYVVKHKKID
jgi:hypothetical protein